MLGNGTLDVVAPLVTAWLSIGVVLLAPATMNEVMMTRASVVAQAKLGVASPACMTRRHMLSRRLGERVPVSISVQPAGSVTTSALRSSRPTKTRSPADQATKLAGV